MKYTINEVAQSLNMPVTTIRYYDKKGFLPFIERKSSGYRLFSDDDVLVLETIDCLKQTGLSLDEIKNLVNSSTIMSDGSYDHYAMFSNGREILQKKIDCLTEIVTVFDERCSHYPSRSKNNNKEIE